MWLWLWIPNWLIRGKLQILSPKQLSMMCALPLGKELTTFLRCSTHTAYIALHVKEIHITKSNGVSISTNPHIMLHVNILRKYGRNCECLFRCVVWPSVLFCLSSLLRARSMSTTIALEIQYIILAYKIYLYFLVRYFL